MDIVSGIAAAAGILNQVRALNEAVASARQLAQSATLRQAEAPDFLSLLKTRLESGQAVTPVLSGANPRTLAADYLVRKDRNGDGMLSRAEFDGRGAWFSALDRDEDGKLTLAELQAPFENT
ncbi:MAG TPA: hypothetical protein PK349_05560 [Candidatus Hydrogenedentes bacterium]|nr:hypothetical protein [Candidatus Hydrogenedentota bacterium]